MLKDYFFLAIGNLKHRGLRSWLTILGIFIGIAAVVALISLGSGLQEAITGQFSTLSTDKLTIQNAGTGFGPPGSTVVEKLTEHDLKIVEDVQGVEIVVPRIIRVIEVEYRNEVKFNYAADVPNDKEKIEVIYSSLNVNTQKGRLLKETDSGKVVIGKDIATQFEKELETGNKITIEGKSFEIVGILGPASTFIVNQAIMMTNSDLEEILNIEDEIDIIIAQVENEKQIEEVAKRIEDKLRKDRDLDFGEEDFSVQTPIEALEAVTTILNIVNLIVIGIAAISLLVGGIGIANTMYTSVIERTKEIGIMKAVGAENKDIATLFVIESGLLGLMGGIVGALIGITLAYFVQVVANSAFETQLITITFSPILIFAAISFSFFVGIVSGILPALQASKLKVVDAIRGTG